MGMRSNAFVTKSNAAAAMAPALTEPVSQQKLSSPATAASPRPGYLTISNNCQFNCATNKELTETESFPLNGLSNSPSTVDYMEQPITNCSTSNNNDGTTNDREEDLGNVECPSNEQVIVNQSENTVSSNNQENLSTMGLLKDSTEVEQMLGELTSTSDIDLMQVFKSFVSAPTGDNLCDLAGGLSLFTDMNMDMNINFEEVSTPTKESDTLEIRNEISKRHSQMIRKLDFLIRRLRKLQSLSMGHHINEEVNGLFEYTQTLLKRKERESKSISTMAPLAHQQSDKSKHFLSCSLKTLLNKLEMVSNSQQSSLKEKVTRIGQSTELTNNLSMKTIPKPQFSNCVPCFDVDANQQLEHTSGLLQAEMKYVAKAIDSDATASSSGGESADEMVTYNNSIQQSLPISKRAAWRWNRDRAGIASRWTWLLAQISDLEYRIHQHSELHNQIKRKKGAIVLDDIVQSSCEDNQTEQPAQQSLNGYRGILPGNTRPLDVESPNGAFDTEISNGSARTRSFQRSAFRKRKLLQTTNLHTISKKAARQSTIKCGCQWPLHPCALCTGRQDPTAPRDLPDMIPLSDRVAVLDPGFHPVISFVEDIPQSVHIEATLRLPDFQNKAFRSTSKSAIKSIIALQKSIDRDEHRLSKSFDLPPKKYKYKKYNLVASKLKKKAKKSNLNRSLTNHGKEFKSLTAPSTPGSDGLLQDSDFGPNGALRSRNASPTHGSSHKTRENYSDRKNRNSYDIDNIVIHSVAASTRVEPLPYKEIPTPKWRVCDDVTETKPEETKPEEAKPEENEEEDVSFDNMMARHERAFLDEKKKFSTFLKFPWSTRSRANRRIDSQMDSSGANTPDATSPAPEVQSVVGDHESIPSPAAPITQEDTATSEFPLATGPSNGNIINSNILKPERRRTLSSKKSIEDQSHRSNSPEPKEIVQPFEPLEFPLSQTSFDEMLLNMPTDHQKLSDETANETTSTVMFKRIVDDMTTEYSLKYLSGPTSIGSDEETESVESGMMDEDPNDPEWCQPQSRF